METPVEITLRNEDLDNADKDYKILMYKLLTKKNIAVHDGRTNDNRGGVVDVKVNTNTRTGVCPCGVGSGGAIRSDGKYYYCAFNDLNKKSLIGDLKVKDLQILRQGTEWKNVVNNHVDSNYTDICKTCTAQW
jgi:radical SAM protein with 4Fe4S-binding SPASM domain